MVPAADREGATRASSSGTSSSRPSAWKLGAAADQLGQHGDRLGVAERGEALDAEGVEIVAGEQGEVGVVAAQQARLAVVQEVALAHRLDHERVLAGGGGGARAERGEQAEDGPLGRSTTCGEIGVSSSRRRAARSWRASVRRIGARSSQRLLERLGGGFQRAVDRRLVVGEGDEPGLELRGRRVDAALEHRPAEAGVGLEVAGRGGGEVGDRRLR